MRDTINILIAVFTLAATILIGWITIDATLTTAQWGASPPKSLMANYIGPSDPLDDLNQGGSSLSIKVQNLGEDIPNLRIVQATLKNDGLSPILPADMIEPLMITSDKPWEIIGIANQELYNRDGVQLKWRKITDYSFQSQPTLLNSGDKIVSTVYLNWNGEGEVPKLDRAPVKWSARIANLKEISLEPDMLNLLAERYFLVSISMSGWKLIFMVVSFIIYNGLTMLLAVKTNLLNLGSTFSVISLPFVGFLNMAAAEAGASLVFTDDFLWSQPPNFALNVPVIMANAAMIAYLFVRFHRNQIISSSIVDEAIKGDIM